MFFLIGIRTKAKAIAQQERACTKCLRPTMQAIVQTKKWFTLFFVPVIPLCGNFFARCGVCGLNAKCTSELKDQLAIKAMAAKA
jgi:zinc-ribbon family